MAYVADMMMECCFSPMCINICCYTCFVQCCFISLFLLLPNFLTQGLLETLSLPAKVEVRSTHILPHIPLVGLYAAVVVLQSNSLNSFCPRLP